MCTYSKRTFLRRKKRGRVNVNAAFVNVITYTRLYVINISWPREHKKSRGENALTVFHKNYNPYKKCHYRDTFIVIYDTLVKI